MRLHGLLFVAAAGCYRPSARPGAPCSADLTCPSGEQCDTLMSPPTCVSGAIADAPMNDGQPDGTVFTDAPAACGDQGACTGDTPVCDTGTCRACEADTECASAACNESTGACFAEVRVAYVAMNGDDTQQCLRLHPCATIARAYTERTVNARDVIRVGPGTFSAALAINNGTLTLSGASTDRSQTTIRYPASGGGASYIIDQRSSTVFVESLVFSGGSSGALRAQNAADLTLDGVDVTNSGGIGIDLESSNVHLFATGINASANAGIRGSGGTLEIDAAYISGNTYEGISLNDTAYHIVNTILASNLRGGFVLVGATIPVQAVFDFNTVYGNTGVTYAGFRGPTGVKASNSIFSHNGATPQVATAAATSYCLFDDALPTSGGTNDVLGTPDFVDATGGDLHITPSSAAHDAADPAAVLDHDYDDDARPDGPHSDIGADEL